jgi:hypothetical protein
VTWQLLKTSVGDVLVELREDEIRVTRFDAGGQVDESRGWSGSVADGLSSVAGVPEEEAKTLEGKIPEWSLPDQPAGVAAIVFLTVVVGIWFLGAAALVFLVIWLITSIW